MPILKSHKCWTMIIEDPRNCLILKNLRKFLKAEGIKGTFSEGKDSLVRNKLQAVLEGDAESLLPDVKQVCKISDKNLRFKSVKERFISFGYATPKGLNNVELQVLVPLVDFDGKGLNGNEMNLGPHKPAPGQVLMIYLTNYAKNDNESIIQCRISVYYDINVNDDRFSDHSLKIYPQLAY